jgi:hypothetical protein
MPSWIKIRADLESDPRVHRMAAHIARSAPGYILTSQAKDLFGSVTDTVTRNALRDVTVMGLSRVWFAANDHTTDGVFRHADLSYLDDLAHIPGFGAAMESVGYAIHDPEAHTVTLPRFVEHNAPDKNGERSKTAAARRQQRLRDKKKAAEAAVELLQEQPSTTVNEVNYVNSTHNAVTSRVTPPVTSRHEGNNVTTSLSCSLSISESKNSESDSEGSAGTPARLTLDDHKARIDTLRPAWKKMPAWSHEDEAALFAALPNLEALESKDWLMLVNYMKWANSVANQGKDAHKVTSRRHAFLESLPSYLDRATAHWKQSGCPKLTANNSKPPSTTANAPKEPPAPELPPAANAAAFAGLLAANGIHRHPTVATKPAA